MAHFSLQIDQDRIAQDTRMRGHTHPGSHLCIVLDGGFEENLGTRITECPQGTARLSPGGVPHDLQFGSTGGTCLVLEARGRFWSRVFETKRAGTHTMHQYARLSDDEIEALRLIKSTLDLVTDRQAALTIGTVLATSARGHALRAPVWLDEALDALECPLRAQSKVRRVAAQARIHRVQFSREFRAHTGWRPVEYRALVRARMALGLLRTSGMPLVDVALECGYSHQSHLTTALSVLVGATPGSLRG
jgi:AraC family transcriptional regulator